MTTGFQNSAGLDMDQVFAARVSAQAVTTGFQNAAGEDLAAKLQPLSGNPKVGTQGFQLPDGRDFCQVFDTTASTPRNFAASASNVDQASSYAACIINPDGSVQAEGNDTAEWDNWSSPNVSGIGSQYEALLTQGSTSGQGEQTGNALGVWYSLSSSVTRGISTHAPRNGNRIFDSTITVQIRRASDQVVVCTGTLTLHVEAYDIE